MRCGLARVGPGGLPADLPDELAYRQQDQDLLAEAGGGDLVDRELGRGVLAEAVHPRGGDGEAGRQKDAGPDTVDALADAADPGAATARRPAVL
ncbi:hypothetical protein CCR90_01620 [Rhodovulum sulfidophilum]|nr:hypothetical protein [Rhodovulum sulfidophilum]